MVNSGSDVIRDEDDGRDGGGGAIRFIWAGAGLIRESESAGEGGGSTTTHRYVNAAREFANSDNV